MTDLDHRLHRAGRELRELPVDVPPLDVLGIAPARRSATALPGLLATLLLVAGGLVGYQVGRSHPDHWSTDEIASTVVAADGFDPPTVADRTRDPVLRIAGPMSPADEVALVASVRPTPDVAGVRRQVRWS